MNLVCLDLEGVLVPEIWINVALKTGIKELKLTTRDIPDYDVLMNKRLGILKENNLKLTDIQEVIATMDPLPGAYEFSMALRSKTQLIILSDTFDQFAAPLMKKLDWPTLFCNTLVIDEQNRISGYRLRQKDGKRKAIEAFRTAGFNILAAGDSYNDLTMIKMADKGLFFRSPPSIQKENPEIKAVEEYKDLLAAVNEFLEDQE
ncbi:bifunctional phosphoserine phosphatase/homoserine phosphotransferase ThrH [Oceanispirochaeta sp.]|jgi:phosphoserine/homoserine phosphotransferase|uniref:bifunctional phosphoserine phosphatase/homoserine phosphotransferase ThrH n=1 Tax=Oceanispirochaeta sp. TaxID=2035350 RepID=UPI002605765B|nr:bifunctional phosphoserine phosphatase/homoserine phosphotransferase ThrH [Oceanispirochaeta sp.]MDA3957378.1 bifunctional phosphoserine phosphatase/homoserine phosphotransferase ThrH [Oceanispirochaeta sp.]